MKQKLLALAALLLAPAAATRLPAQGWPEKYGGVMLQGFYWDSYSDTRWAKLEEQADELSEYFDLIWVPNSGYCNTLSMNMGYLPVYWFDHKSAFGTEEELRSMIRTFKDKGTGIIEDVVINHKVGKSDWCDFANEERDGRKVEWTLADICAGDDYGKTKEAGYAVTGAADTGDDFDGGRDIDHTSANVQGNVRTYLDFLLNDLGYAGFRYDMVKGYAPRYTAMYNASAKPQFSVGECWDGYDYVKGWIDGTKADGAVQSAAFDFPMRGNIKSAFGDGLWVALGHKCLAGDEAYRRYAVTFVDNHDTGSPGKDGATPLTDKVEAANAYLLAMPGTPCVFLLHWKAHKTAIKKLITLRRILGINSQSEITRSETAKAPGGSKVVGYVISVKGDGGSALVAFGDAEPDTAGFKRALTGDSYRYYVPEGTDISGLDGIKDEVYEIPGFCTVADGETCAFFEAPGDAAWEGDIYCWRWDRSNNYTGNVWPGVKCDNIGTAGNGRKVWKWTYKEEDKVSTPGGVNEGIIFSRGTGGSPQTADMPFENGGYYTEDGLKGAVTGIRPPAAGAAPRSCTIYNIEGVRMDAVRAERLPHGVYIINGKKVSR